MTQKTLGFLSWMHPSIYLSFSLSVENKNVITRIYYKYLSTAAMYIAILKENIVKNNPIHQRKFCNVRLTGCKIVNSAEKNIFNFETLPLILTLEFKKTFINNKAIINT